MIRASELRGRALVDLDDAEKMGEVDELILNADGSWVAGLVVSRGQAFLSSGERLLLPASAIEAVGPDAVTVRRGMKTAEAGDLVSLPRVSHLLGRKMVTVRGRLLGHVSDLLIEELDGRIVGYVFEAGHSRGPLEAILGFSDTRDPDYVRADADMRVGTDLVVVPDDAVVTGAKTDDRVETLPSAGANAPTLRWADAPPPPLGRRVWSVPETEPADTNGTSRQARANGPATDATIVIHPADVTDANHAPGPERHRL